MKDPILLMMSLGNDGRHVSGPAARFAHARDGRDQAIQDMDKEIMKYFSSSELVDLFQRRDTDLMNVMDISFEVPFMELK